MYESGTSIVEMIPSPVGKDTCLIVLQIGNVLQIVYTAKWHLSIVSF